VDRYEELRGWVTEALNLSGAPCGEAREALLNALREIRDLMSGVEVHESQRGGVCSDCVDAVRQAREFAVRTLAETVPPSVEGGEDGPAVLVVPRPKLDALRLILAVEAHVCSCGDCESQAYADRCRFEAALRELVGA
jgi:hypothetical protein